MASYWERQITRRRVLATTGAGAGVLALTVIGCGGGSKDSSGIAEGSRVTQPKDTTSQAKRGTIYQGFVNTDETSFDPLASSRGGGAGGPSVPAYSRMLKEKEYPGQPPSQEIIGDLAESWELSNDGLTLTMKIRPDAKFDPRPPTSGKAVTSDDVVFALEKFFAQSPYNSQLSNKVDPASPMIGATKVDARTVTYKMAFPWSPLLATLANGNHLVLPTEADGGFNPKTDIRGSGPWMLTDYQGSVRMQWRKNPNWYEKSYPLLDGYDTPIVTEVAAQLAQFKAKNIWHVTPTQASDVIDLANSEPTVQLFKGLVTPSITSVAFGSKPGSPFYDQRMRQAVSMAIDRDAFATADSGADFYERAGIPFPLTISSNISSFWGDLWLDPRSDKLGEGAKYYKHDLTAAKQLVSAAGYPNGLDFQAYVASAVHAGPTVGATLASMMADAGIRPKLEVVDYNAYFLPKIWVPGAVKGDYEGQSFGNSGGSQGHIMTYLYIDWHTKGSFTASRRWDSKQDEIDGMIERGLREFDANKQKQIVWDIQKQLATYMSGVTYTYGRGPYVLAWPWVQNYNAWRTPQGDTAYLHLWIDDTKKT